MVEYKFTNAFKWLRANESERTTEPFYRVSGLQDDLDYEFRVAAENRAGVGPYSEATLPIKAHDPKGFILILCRESSSSSFDVYFMLLTSGLAFYDY